MNPAGTRWNPLEQTSAVFKRPLRSPLSTPCGGIAMGWGMLLKSLNLCPGGIAWESLELEQGPGTVVGQIENVAQGSQQILVQQAPGSYPATSLQSMLQLPAYPADDGAPHEEGFNFARHVGWQCVSSAAVSSGMSISLRPLLCSAWLLTQDICRQ